MCVCLILSLRRRQYNWEQEFTKNSEIPTPNPVS